MGGGISVPTTWTYEGSTVPGNTIKKGYDVYKDRSYKTPVKADERFGGSSALAGDCASDNPMRYAQSIFRSDGKNHKGQHREMWCRDYLFGNDCGDCDFWPQDKDPKPGFISSYRVPIGLYLKSRGGDKGTNSKEESTNCSSSGNDIGWNFGQYKGKNGYPPRVPSEVAIGCSGGSSLGQDQYAKTLNNFQIDHGSGKKSNKCFLGPETINEEDKVVCVQSGVDWDTFCQLGDNIFTNEECKKRCKDKKEGEGSTNYCNYALDRMCATKKDEFYKSDAYGNNVKATKNYMTSQPQCELYCGNAENPRCRVVKNKMCENSKDWIKFSSWLPDYCRAHWKANKDETAMNKACKAELLDPNGEQNIFSKNGCGKLCMGDGTDVDDRWCKYRTLEYCTSSDDLMLTEECYQFCADAENGDLCDNYLQGENGLCKRLNVKTEEDLKKSVGETGRNVSDWCGCMMPTTFYEKHRDTMLKAFDDEGYNIKGQIDLQPECMYPLCKQGSIKTKSQQSRLDNGECTDCVQIMLNKFESPGDINATVAAKQEMSCENIEKKIPDPLIPGYYNLKPSNTKIRVFADKSYCIYRDQEEYEKNTSDHDLIDIDSVPITNSPRDPEFCIKESSVVEENSTSRSSTNIEITKEEGEIAGAVIALIIVFILLGLLIAWFIKRKKNSTKITSNNP